jgi:hypothetical protein
MESALSTFTTKRSSLLKKEDELSKKMKVKRTNSLKIRDEDVILDEKACHEITGLSIIQFMNLSGELRPFLEQRSNITGRKSIFGSNDALLMFFYRVRSGCSPKWCSQVFGVSKSVLTTTFYNVLDQLWTYCW